MRPVSLLWFDRLFFAAMALRVAFNALETWQAFKPSNAVNLLSSFVTPFAIDCILWFFISCRASNFAKWLWVFWLVIPLISLPFLSIMVGRDYIGGLLLYGPLEVVVEMIRISLSIVAAILLFRSDAAKWFTSRGKLVDVSDFS